MENTSNILISIPFELDYENFENLMVGAIEGGSSYWASMDSRELPESIKTAYKGEPFSVKVSRAIWEGHTVKVYDVEDPEECWTIDKKKVEAGLLKMSKDYSSHFQDFVNDNQDATTSDVFFQLISIGELTFG